MGWICPGCGQWVDRGGHSCPAGEFYDELDATPQPIMGEESEIEELHNPYLARIATALERIADALDPQN